MSEQTDLPMSVSGMRIALYAMLNQHCDGGRLVLGDALLRGDTNMQQRPISHEMPQRGSLHCARRTLPTALDHQGAWSLIAPSACRTASVQQPMLR